MSTRIGSSRVLALACLLLFVTPYGLAGCSRSDPSDPRLRERVISIDGDALVRFLERIARLEDTPAAAYSQRLLERARSCDELFGHFVPAGSGGGISAELDGNALDCGGASGAPGELEAFARSRRADADGVLSWPLGEDGHLALRIDVDPLGGLTLDGQLTAPSEPGALRLFLPAEEQPAAPAIAPDKALVKLRIRPRGGLGLSSLLPSGGQADRLFALKGRLLEGALLEGTWELAFLPPAEGGDKPLAIGALHHRNADALRAALDEALTQLEATWPIQRTPRVFHASHTEPLEGGCFLDLPILPEFAPCWVVTPEAFLIGYRGEAIDLALAPPAVSSAPKERPDKARTSRVDDRSGSRIDVHLDRVKTLDARSRGESAAVHLGELFSKLELRLGTGVEGQTTVHARLRAAP